MTDESRSPRYLAPGWITRRLLNPTIAGLARAGISVWGSRELRVKGRKSGQWRATPVNLLTVGADRYLVAPRGTAQWVRNLRVAGSGELRVGRRVETFRFEELADEDKAGILRDYLRRWKFEIGAFFEGVGPDASDEQLTQIAPGYPVFRIIAA
ncbi:MAG: hypothetical protein JWN95_2271 [Frankiales bacterium]|nr:hypothetical protein [Frankiales bacterium]